MGGVVSMMLCLLRSLPSASSRILYSTSACGGNWIGRLINVCVSQICRDHCQMFIMTNAGMDPERKDWGQIGSSGALIALLFVTSVHEALVTSCYDVSTFFSLPWRWDDDSIYSLYMHMLGYVRQCWCFSFFTSWHHQDLDRHECYDVFRTNAIG